MTTFTREQLEAWSDPANVSNFMDASLLSGLARALIAARDALVEAQMTAAVDLAKSRAAEETARFGNQELRAQQKEDFARAEKAEAEVARLTAALKECDCDSLRQQLAAADKEIIALRKGNAAIAKEAGYRRN